MAGRMYLGNQMVTPVIVQGEEKVFNVDGYDLLGSINNTGVLSSPSNFLSIIFNGVTDISEDCFYYEENDLWPYVKNIVSSVSFPDLKNMTYPFGCDEIFISAKNISSALFENLESISGNYAFTYSFYNAKPINVIRFPKLNLINASKIFECCFSNSTITNIYFNSLNQNSFGSYTNQFSYMIEDCSNVTVHFPVGLDATIGNWSDVLAGFGGTNTTILYDL